MKVGGITMQEQFDPYRKWLGIPPEEQPPNFYRLLGLAVFESDPDVISHAADRQMAHIRTFQTGRYAAVTQRLLNELSAARLCLLDKIKRAQYDALLRSLGWGAAVTAPPVIAPPVRTGGYPQQSGYAAYPAATPVPQGTIQSSAPLPPGGMGDDPIGLMSGGGSTSLHRPLVQRKQQSSAVPLVIGGVCVVLLLVAVVLIVNNLNQPEPVRPTASNPPPVAPPAPSKKSDDKDKDKDKDKGGATSTPEPEAKASGKGTDTAGKTPDTTAKTPDTSKKPPGATGKLADSTGPKKSDAGKTTESTKPPGPKRAEGEMPDFGPLPPLASNDTSLDLSALPIPGTSSTRLIVNELLPQWKEALLKAPSREEKLEFAKILLNQAGAARSDIPRQYVLLKAAYDLAVDLGDAETFLKATNQLTSVYAVDPWEAKARAFQHAGGGSAPPEELLELLPECEKLISAAVSADRFDAAVKFAHAASILATKGKSLPDAKKFDALVSQLDQAAKEREAADKAQETLADRRNDPQASLVYGGYLSFIKGNWQKGIPYLKKSEDIDVKQAADLDASNPFAAEKQADVADAWFAVAKKYDGLKRTEILKRSKFWYDRAVAGLTDKDKTDVEAKLKEIAEMLGSN